MIHEDEEEELTPAEDDKVDKEGRDAYHAGKDREEANPYPEDSLRFDVWKHGWDSAFECEVMEENDEEDAQP